MTKVSRTMKRCNLLQSETDAVYHEACKRLGVSDSTMIVLYTVSLAGDRCPLSEIVRLSGLSKQTVNSAIRNMEADGILYLEAVGIRSKDVILTEKGRALSEETALRLLSAEDAVFAAWDKEDVEQYFALAERFVRDLKEKINMF